MVGCVASVGKCRQDRGNSPKDTLTGTQFCSECMGGVNRSYRRLDIRELQRKGFLRPGGWTSLSWSRNGDAVGSVGVCAEFDRVVLRYRHQRYGEDWKDEEYPIFLDRTPCNYGGERVWFLCPARG